MQYTIKYACGHMGTVVVEGTKKEQAAKVKWYELNAHCPTCWWKMQKEKELGPNGVELKGTEKQISWAEEIRRDKIAEAKKFFVRWKARACKDNKAKIGITRGKVICAMTQQQFASWWIARRNYKIAQIIGDVMDEKEILTDYGTATRKRETNSVGGQNKRPKNKRTKSIVGGCTTTKRAREG